LEVLTHVKHLLWNRQAIKELGEPILWQDGQVWLIACEGKVMTGFLTYLETERNYKVQYLYVLPDFRRLKVAARLYEAFEQQTTKKPIQAIATHMSLDFFKSAGFEVTKAFVNYFKVEKQWNN
jgi:GNAT superfamily N-acetyltransferase